MTDDIASVVDEPWIHSNAELGVVEKPEDPPVERIRAVIDDDVVRITITQSMCSKNE